jgi:ribonuclease HI
MPKKKFYVVIKGRKPGIYREWFGQDGAQAQVSGFPGAVYKGFPTLSDAEQWFQPGREPGMKRAPAKHAIIHPSPQSPDKCPRHNQRGIVRHAGFDPASSPDFWVSASAGMTDLRQVTIYTDGACVKNPGQGGYGVVILDGENRRELSGGFRLTTNNRMEIMAAIAGLQALDVGCDVTIYSDSKYLVDAITLGWVERWRARNWQRSPSATAVNPDLWEILLQLCARHRVKFVWLRGHAGNVENERCDRLAVRAAQEEDLPPDIQYEAASS